MKHQPHREFGQRLKDARLARKMTQAQLAQAIGNNRSGLTRAEQGVCSMSSYHLARAAQALGVSADYLLGLTGGKATPQDNFRDRIALIDRQYVAGVLEYLDLSGQEIDRCMDAVREAWNNGYMTERIEDLILSAGEQAKNAH